MTHISKPNPDEYAPYAADYINLIPDDGKFLQHLEQQLQLAKDLVLSIPAEQLGVPCAENEWTVKEVLIHIMDTERVFCYRALRFGRNDPTQLFPVDQDLYVKYSGANARSIEEILAEYASIRLASLTLFSSFSEEALLRRGLMRGHDFSVRGLAWLMAGHELHHLNSIQQNYLISKP